MSDQNTADALERFSEAVIAAYETFIRKCPEGKAKKAVTRQLGEMLGTVAFVTPEEP